MYKICGIDHIYFLTTKWEVIGNLRPIFKDLSLLNAKTNVRMDKVNTEGVGRVSTDIA